MAAAYSKDLRESIVNAYQKGFGSIKKVSDFFSVCERSVDKYLYLFRNNIDLNPGKSTGRTPIIQEKELKIIHEMVDDKPDQTLDEYCQIFHNQTDILIGKSIMDRAFKKLNITRKKKSYYAQEQERPDVQKKRNDFIDSIISKNPEDFIFLDEAGADMRMDNEYARAKSCDRVKAAKPFQRGQKISLLSAIGILGIIDFIYVELAINADIFLHFITNMLCPKLKKGQVILMDNANIHTSPEIKKAIESRGAILVYLPPYSPDLSPIEKMWSKIKSFMKKLKPRTLGEFHNALVEAISALDINDFEEWYDSCGYQLA